MTLSHTLGFAGFAALIGSAVSSCISPPNYPDTPSIDFKEIKDVRYKGATGEIPRDSVTITVNFKDGDGDLGLSEKDKDPPYNFTNADGTENRNYYNYFIQPFVRNANGAFEPVVLATRGGYNSRYPRLSPVGDRPAPLKGTLSLKLGFYLGQPFYPGQVVRFEVSIMDRALHESNKITTDPITIAPK